MSWCIYKHTSPTGKCYIGKAVEPAEHRWGKNGKHYNKGKFGIAILLYGWDNFTHEILESNIQTNDEAMEREKYWVDYYNSCLNGYNMLLKHTQWFYYLITVPRGYGQKPETMLRFFFPENMTGEEWDNRIQENFDEQVHNILNFNMLTSPCSHIYLNRLSWGEVFTLNYEEYLKLPTPSKIIFDKEGNEVHISCDPLSEENFNKIKQEGHLKHQQLINWKTKYLNKEFVWQNNFNKELS